ncbi:unnamed protein product [Prorocentrum cordatum]|uniref:EF-hand domain-containing protein n=1 Tax=Prorocentrum cordatum TaxID=2364126 RepID=A0ABN9QIA3_9DINO|nr:unnamed protein product [Polarella glacialis]
MVARSTYFENITLLVIFLNAFWIWIDTDYNTAVTPNDTEFGFVLGENLFCVYFFMEWLIRFMSFKVKRNCFRDSWMVFDSCLVAAMVSETWVMPIMVALFFPATNGTDMGDASILRMMRLLRLTRMARMVRLLRAVPELMTMVRGVVASARSVFLAGILLVALMFVFGIAMRQLSAGSGLGDELFPSVPEAMITLLIDGVFLDEFGFVLRAVGAQSYLTAFVFMCFICLAALTVMNMLIGVVCELVSAVAAREKEERTINMVKEKVSAVMKRVDDDGDGLISKGEFLKMVQEADCVDALTSVGVDVPGLMDIMDMIFLHGDAIQTDSDGEPVLTYDVFIETVYNLRGSNGASVKDVVDLRKFVHQGFGRLEEMVRPFLSALWPTSENGKLELAEDASTDARLRRLEGKVSRILELLESQQMVGTTRTRL